MALETFRDAERELTELDSIAADLERKLELVQSINDTGLRLRSITADAESSLRTEMTEKKPPSKK